MVFGQVYRPTSKSPAPPPPPPLAAPPPPPKAPSPKAPAVSTLKKPSLAKLGGQATDADRGELLKALNSGEAARARLRPTQTRDKSAPAVTAEIEEEKPAVPPPRVVTTPAPPPPPPPAGIAPPPPPPAVRKPSPGPPKNSALAKLGGQASDADRGALLKALNGPVRLRPTQTVDKSAPVVTAEIEEKEGGVRLRVDEAIRSGAATPNSMDGSLAGSRNSLDSQGVSPTKKKTTGKKKIVKKATPGAPPPPPMAPPPPPAVRKASPTPLNPSLAKLGGQATDADRGALLKALNTGGVRAGLRPTQTVDKSAPVVKAEIEEGVSDKEALETLKKSTAASEAAPASPKKLTRQYTNKTSVKSAPPPAPAPPPPPMAPPVEHVRKTSPAPKNAAALSKLGGKATDADRGELLKALNAGGARAGLRPTQTVDKSAPVVTAQIEEGTSTKEALEKLKSLPADSTTAKTTSIYSGAPKRTSVSESPKKTTATEASKKPAPLDLPKKTVVTELAKKEITEVPQSPRGKKGGVSSAIKMFTTPASPVKKAPPTGVRKAVITDVTKKATEPTEPPPKKVTTTAAAAAKVANGTSTTAAVKPANGTTAAKAANGTTAPRKLHTFGPWEQKESAKGRIYYWNNDTKKSQWTRPLEWPAPKKAGLKKQATIEKKRATLKKQATIEEKKKKFLLHRGESEWDELEELLNGVDTSELDLDEILNDDASDDD